MAETLTPPPPEGFVLASPGAAAIPAPPEGFQIQAPAAGPRTADGMMDALKAGYQGSATGLALRGGLPDIVLDPAHAKWYEKALASIGQMGAELPEMIGGAVLGGAAGSAAGPIGTILGGGAGSFAVPAAIRSSLIEAYKAGTAESSGGFLNSARIILGTTAKEAAVGAATFGVGGLVARGVGKAIAPAIGETLTVKVGTRLIGGAQATAELGTMVVTPAVLDGHLPEPEDFLNAAIVLGFAKGAVHVAGPAVNSLAGRLQTIYAKTGVRPEQVVADAARNPEIAAQLMTLYRGQGEGTTPGFHQGGAVWTTPDKSLAEAYARSEKNGEVVSYDVALKKPFVLDDSTIPEFLKFWPEQERASLEQYLNERGLAAMSKESRDAMLAAGYDSVIVKKEAWTDQKDVSGPSVVLLRDPKSYGIGNSNDIPAAYRPLADAETVANSTPEKMHVADILGNLNGKIPDAKQPGHVNYDYIAGPEDLKAVLAGVSEKIADQIAEKRAAPKGWDESLAEARQFAADTAGVKPEDIKTGTVALDAELLARNAAVLSNAFDLREAARVVREKGEQATEQDHRALIAASAALEATLAHSQGRTAEVARALNVMKAMKQTSVLAKEMLEVRERYGNDPQLMAKIIEEMDTPQKLSKLVREATTWEKFVEGWKAAILSGPVTHVANVIGNTTFMAMRPIVDLTASAIGRLTGASERVAAAEPFARIFGDLQGAKDALLLAGSALRIAYEEGGVKGVAKEIAVGSEQGAAQKVEQFRPAIEGVKGDIIRLPFRALSLADGLFKAMNERGEAYALATRQAISEGYNLQTREFRERVVDLVQNDKAIAEQAQAAALRFTFNEPLGEKGQAVQSLVRKAKLEMFVPFIRTPANILTELTRMTPLAPVIGKWREEVAAGGAKQAQALAELGMGTAIMGVVASMALDGSITGQMSPDAGKKRVQTAAGQQPYSWKIGDTYYSYQRLQPIGTLMGLAADMAEVWDHMTDDEMDRVPKMVSIAFANAVTNQTFLQGITNIIRAMDEPKRFMPRLAQNMAGSMVPGIVAQPVTMSDPYVREVNSMMDAIRARLPGREGMLAKRDAWGQPVETKDRTGGISPVTETTESTDKVKLEAVRLGVSVADSPKKVHLGRGSGKLGDVEITPEQRNKYAELSGQMAHEILAPIVNAPNWDQMSDLVQKRIYQRAFTMAHKNAALNVFPPEQRSALIGQITEKVQQELTQ